VAKYTTFANDILDLYVDTGASGTATIGATTYTKPYRIRWLSTVSVAGTPGTEWATASGYTAGGVSIAGLVGTAAASASKANTGAVSVTNAPAGTWADNDQYDSTATAKRMVFRGGASLAKTVNLGDTCTIGTGSLTWTEA
jgi:hypothetical protein